MSSAGGGGVAQQRRRWTFSYENIIHPRRFATLPPAGDIGQLLPERVVAFRKAFLPFVFFMKNLRVLSG